MAAAGFRSRAEHNRITLAGTAFNPAHVRIMRSLQLKTRIEAVKRIKEILTRMGKEVSLEIY
jgi:hypothetical protein